VWVEINCEIVELTDQQQWTKINEYRWLSVAGTSILDEEIHYLVIVIRLVEAELRQNCQFIRR
jgi:hypothetical protein